MKYLLVILTGLFITASSGCFHANVNVDGDKWRDYGEKMGDKYAPKDSDQD